MPDIKPFKYWVIVNGSAKKNIRREAEAIHYAEKQVKNDNMVVIIETRYKQDVRLHVWENGIRTVISGRVVK